MAFFIVTNFHIKFLHHFWKLKETKPVFNEMTKTIFSNR